jgi:hypothetical protein
MGMVICHLYELGMVKKWEVEQRGLAWIMSVIDYYPEWAGPMGIVLESLEVWRHRESL